jgi:hypothetical protein
MDDIDKRLEEIINTEPQEYKPHNPFPALFWIAFVSAIIQGLLTIVGVVVEDHIKPMPFIMCVIWSAWATFCYQKAWKK